MGGERDETRAGEEGKGKTYRYLHCLKRIWRKELRGSPLSKENVIHFAHACTVSKILSTVVKGTAASLDTVSGMFFDDDDDVQTIVIK